MWKVILHWKFVCLTFLCPQLLITCEADNKPTPPLRLTIDPVNIYWRPLTFYAVVAAINLAFRTQLRYRWNTKHASYNGLEYLLYTPEYWNPDKQPRPVIFVHGLGLGLMQYNYLLSNLLRECQDRPVLILLQAHISQNIFHPLHLKPLSQRQTTERLSTLMQELGWVNAVEMPATSVSESHGVTMISHSKYIHFARSLIGANHSIEVAPMHMPGC